MLNRKDVEHIANLAQLKLSEEEVENFAEQLGQIVDWMGKLNKLDLDDVEPTAHILPVKNVFREDKVHRGFTLDEALNSAPDRDGSFFRVPPIMADNDNAGK